MAETAYPSDVESGPIVFTGHSITTLDGAGGWQCTCGTLLVGPGYDDAEIEFGWHNVALWISAPAPNRNGQHP